MAAFDDFMSFLAGRKMLRKASGEDGDVTQGASPTPMRPSKPGMSQEEISDEAEKQAQRAGRGTPLRGATSPQLPKKKKDSVGYSAY